MRKFVAAAAVVITVLAGTTRGYSQPWSIGGNTGLSVLGGSPGLQLTPATELLINQNIGIGSEFSINTQYSAPLIWYPYFKYYFSIHGSQVRPFASVGPVLALNVPNGPCFGFLFGGGFKIPVARRLYLAPNVLLGPIFNYAGGAFPFVLRGYYWGFETYGLLTYKIPSVTVFAFSLRGGIEYEI